MPQDKPNFTSDCEKALRAPLSPPPNLKSPPNDWHPPKRIENAGSTPSTFATVLLVVSVCYAHIVLFSFFANGGDRQLAEKKAVFFLKFEGVPSWVVWVLFTSYCVACALKYLCTSIANALICCAQVFLYRLRRGK